MTRYSKLEGNQCFWFTPNITEQGMTGSVYAKQDQSGAITLTYEDGSEEMRTEAEAPEIQSFDSYLKMVGWVQAGRA